MICGWLNSFAYIVAAYSGVALSACVKACCGLSKSRVSLERVFLVLLRFARRLGNLVCLDFLVD